MGQSHSAKECLSRVTQFGESSLGKLSITGRYHCLPTQITDDYKIHDTVLGSGYNGKVFLLTSIISGKEYAVKNFQLHGISQVKMEELAAEVEIFLATDHPHITRLVDVYESNDTLQLVMERMCGGELFARIMEKKCFSERDAADVGYQMLLAVNYIHSHNVVHRDLKLENFLYESADTNHLKLIDFGFSKVFTPNTKMALSCGTLSYMAPEVLAENYTSQCDLWSFGVIVFILVFGYMPFLDVDGTILVDNLEKAEIVIRPDNWEGVSNLAIDFVRKLLVVDPSLRLTASEALEHEWIANREGQSESDAVTRSVVDALTSFGRASSFRRSVMSMMAWSLTSEDRAEINEAFLEFDRDKNGTIQLVEFKQLLLDRFQITDEVAMKTFEAIDLNHDEEIHYTEFLAAMVSSRIRVHDDLLKVTFRRFDRDSKGYITRDCLDEILGESIDSRVLDKFVELADSSKDGNISFTEWMDYLRGGTDEQQETAIRVIDSQLSITVDEGGPRSIARRNISKTPSRKLKSGTKCLAVGSVCKCILM